MTAPRLGQEAQLVPPRSREVKAVYSVPTGTNYRKHLVPKRQCVLCPENLIPVLLDELLKKEASISYEWTGALVSKMSSKSKENHRVITSNSYLILD